ncbi:hypothetical protein KZC51_17370 [Microbacterium sp. SSW1-49]|uniref:Signal transduction histidine kinase subgroup 3 dimerisation and phosphoacceptor domain-containing protein n=1 Tax=Microbacterium croceum TaxID=2851645 RepID=A0ABT0FIL2_9MICO|nr:hypothetical protein [Microbacterium croceum]MCK2037902.1 hypothetical protein [Microbacterium croceum]
MSTRTLLGRGARGALLWISLVTLSAPVVGGMVKGSFARADNWPLHVAVVGALLGVTGLLLPWEARLRTGLQWRPLVIVAAAVITASVVLLIDTPAYEPSMFTMAVALCGFVILSGHAKLGATVGFVLIAARGIAVVMIVDSPGILYVVDIYPILMLSLALVWLHYAHVRARREAGFRARSAIALRQLQKRERELAQLRMHTSVASSGARSALERIVATEELTPDLALDIRIAEAALRDHIRCAVLEHPQLTDAIAAARRRGASVLLLDARSGARPSGEQIGDGLAQELAACVRGASAQDQVTIRVLSGSPGDPVAVSVLIDRADGSDDLFVLEADGDRRPDVDPRLLG